MAARSLAGQSVECLGGICAVKSAERQENNDSAGAGAVHEIGLRIDRAQPSPAKPSPAQRSAALLPGNWCIASGTIAEVGGGLPVASRVALSAPCP